MTTPTLLEYLSKHGVVLIPYGTMLRYKAPIGFLTINLRREIIRRKVEILEILHSSSAVAKPEELFELSLSTETKGIMVDLHNISPDLADIPNNKIYPAVKQELKETLRKTQANIAMQWPWQNEACDVPWNWIKNQVLLWPDIIGTEDALNASFFRGDPPEKFHEICLAWTVAWQKAINLAVAKFGNTLPWPRRRYTDPPNWDLNAATEAFPWPLFIPGIGSRRFSGNENCNKCRYKTSYVYGEIPLCLYCAEEKTMRFPVSPKSYFGWLHRWK